LWGEVFAITMPDTDQAGALQLAERLRAAIQALELPGRARGDAMTASLGIATAEEGIDTFDQLYPRADTLLYLAKSRGRNRCVGDFP
jgi:diguanylate cyclase (GGDEF)-like protein